MADEGGVLLRIDANTAAYLAKLSALADSHEKITKHVDEWGHAAEHVIGHLAAMAGPLVLIEEIVRNTEKGFEAWKEHLEAAGKTTQTLVETLRRTTAQTGENRQNVEDQLVSVASPQSVAERVSGFNAFRQNAPGSSTRVAPSEVARRLGQAHIAGYDTDQFASIAGNVEGVAGGKAFDLASLLISRTGSNADQASGLIRRLGDKAGPQGAQQALPYLLASAQAGDRRFSFVSDAMNGYNPAFGDFGSYLTGRLKHAGPGQRGLANSIGSRLPQAQEDIAGMSGLLGRRAEEALGDESVMAAERNKLYTSQAEIENFHKRKEWQEGIEERAARRKLGAVEDPFDAAIMPNIHEGIQVLMGKHRGRGYADEALESLSGGGKSATDHLEEISGHLQKQNAIIDKKQLRPDAHRE